MTRGILTDARALGAHDAAVRGERVVEVAARIGVSPSLLYRRWVELGLPAPRNRPCPRRSVLRALAERHDAGERAVDLAREIGRDARTLRAMWRRVRIRIDPHNLRCPTAERVLEALSTGTRTARGLAADLDTPYSTVAHALVRLEREGAVHVVGRRPAGRVWARPVREQAAK